MSKEIKIQIKSIGGDVLFKYETVNNTVRKTCEKSIKEGTDLQEADLRGANLWRANLWKTNLQEAKNIPSIYKTPLYLLKHQLLGTKLRAFKYLNEGNMSPYRGFRYEIGKTYSVKDYSSDEITLCDKGLNVATLDWCLRDTNCDLTKTYIVVEFLARDIIAIPFNSDGKFRVKKLKVIRKLTKEEIKKAIEPINKTDINKTEEIEK